jgi:hypothetical protein
MNLVLFAVCEMKVAVMMNSKLSNRLTLPAWLIPLPKWIFTCRISMFGEQM